ncbi:outer membrane beta-barrel protein [Cytophagaceae bacterium YF14B1]|uniref:Outer membrane beta-barrel protein n=1 Tax=Xanthocytophaga flava TaxID=3048013 RepID=A0AAE3QM65_9BACT|nr:outer membrane beta-barrel protein [Xanthocytophaga flavus]MDJ1479923.1 outer membrane beta-barrel protein [Xanthocytophaga flavus]
MKKIFIAAIAMISAMTANAQVEQGKLFINGQFGVSSTSYENISNTKSSTFTFIPSVGYFLSDKFAIGLGIGGSTSRTKNTDNNTTSIYNQIKVAPFARYYIPTSGDKFSFFAQGSLAFGVGKEKFKNNSNTSTGEKINTTDFAISPGFVYFPSSHWGVELTLRGFYIEARNSNDNSAGNYDNNKTTIGLDVNSLSPSLGISYFF